MVIKDGLTRSLETIQADLEARKDAANLILASRLFDDPDRLNAFSGLYAFMRRVDDLVDRIAEKEPDGDEIRRIADEVRYWEQVLARAYDTAADDPDENVRFLKSIFRMVPIPAVLWKNFFSAMWMDFNRRRFPDQNAFLTYAEGASVAATTIYLMLIGFEKQPDGRFEPLDFDYLTTGRNLGIWAYSVHLMRDLKEDVLVGAEGRLLIPESVLERHNLSLSDLRRSATGHTSSEPIRRMVLEFLHWGESEFGAPGKVAAMDLMRRLPLKRAKVLGVIVALYAEIGRRIRARKGDVFSKRQIFSESARKRYVISVVRKKSLEDIWHLW